MVPNLGMLDKFEGADFKYDNSLLNFLPQNTQLIKFLVSNLGILIFHIISHFSKFEGADFKYDNNFFTILTEKCPNKAFSVPNLGVFNFSQNFAIRQIRGS